MADQKTPIVGKDADGRVTSVILDTHVSADSPEAVSDVAEANGGNIDGFAHFAEEAPKADKAEKPAK